MLLWDCGLEYGGSMCICQAGCVEGQVRDIGYPVSVNVIESSSYSWPSPGMFGQFTPEVNGEHGTSSAWGTS